MEARFATLHKRKIYGLVPDAPIERKKAFGNVIRKASGKVPREKLFVLLKIQEQKNPLLSLASTLDYMGLQSVDLYDPSLPFHQSPSEIADSCALGMLTLSSVLLCRVKGLSSEMGLRRLGYS